LLNSSVTAATSLSRKRDKMGPGGRAERDVVAASSLGPDWQAVYVRWSVASSSVIQLAEEQKVRFLDEALPP
jgi:hypothetical protein